MRNTKLTFIRKLHVADIANETRNIHGAARKFRFQPSQIRKWQNYEQIKAFADKSLQKLSFTEEKKVQYPEIENKLHGWIIDRRKSALAVSTQTLIKKELTIVPELKSKNTKRIK